MGTDMLMNNADSDTIEASKRAWAFTAVTALVLVLWFAVIAVTPANSSSDISTTPAASSPLTNRQATNRVSVAVQVSTTR